MAERLLYATNNSGKIYEVGKYLKTHGINIISPQDLGIVLDVDETGNTLEENATLKVMAYLQVVGTILWFLPMIQEWKLTP
ncbi:hypothetical protein A2630_03975 [Candidatus Woesebacteria bacterium RIFCSPHIGHO2_01_FULL_44_10]|uniref:Non-canonical purine NTP pyrophosphatase n=1 Tax=Candidatus Woesebacteria bacterium RIFCSPLOWO2_01_FULL_44_14 TaxID=1802525 RepID=A0A1F8C0X2_9BACT|nr:MAG: hypothetical protein A2630_03975 [Candidatus Woesebacteria bacterium RIFCSPHIGHO2_01_FULL_44_10]OGM55968.1 MAG: hypothetical protein A3F62_05335 [Candidatus Woesebacteria bacterium RIFCSPHIGHO2_12_FULL_44_11]OGM69780.1 MAG: hypothetical protein A2975_00280 [Candidatus Woesebacteria bacterium RIFCSPLOWO2_01_FULL_44_14]